MTKCTASVRRSPIRRPLLESLISMHSENSPKVVTFRGSSAVERSPVKRLVAGSNPARGAKKLDTNSFFEDERVRPALPAGRSPSPANGGAGLRFATAPPSLCREMKRILMLSGE